MYYRGEKDDVEQSMAQDLLCYEGGFNYHFISNSPLFKRPEVRVWTFLVEFRSC